MLKDCQSTNKLRWNTTTQAVHSNLAVKKSSRTSSGQKSLAKIGGKDTFIVTDVIESTIPLLFSKDAIKKADRKINFQKKTVTMLGVSTKDGNHSVRTRTILRDLEVAKEVKITSTVESTKDRKKMASKLHL